MVEIPINEGNELLHDMLILMARRVKEGELDERTAQQIRDLLERENKPS